MCVDVHVCCSLGLISFKRPEEENYPLPPLGVQAPLMAQQ